MGSQSRWVLIETETASGLCQRAVCERQRLRRGELLPAQPFLLQRWGRLAGAVSGEGQAELFPCQRALTDQSPPASLPQSHATLRKVTLHLQALRRYY